MNHRPVLLVIAHGSRDPRHAATVQALVRRAGALRPGLRVETAFLDFNLPSVTGVLDRLAAERVRDVVALPLLLTRAFHAKADVPAVLRQAPASLRIRQAEVLGPSPLLVAAVERRLYEAGPGPGDKSATGVVLASAGSTDPEAIAVIAETARELRRTGWCSVRPAFASAVMAGGVPRTEDAVRALRAEPGVRRVAVAPYVIAPGRLPDRIAAGAAEADVLAGVLGPSPELARLLLARYDGAARAAERVEAAAV
ncbi:sirohydrochlorin chelatase [Streptomyces sp. WAC08241]|uniref:sirohydrochlorin chelatase n=1 Tax=Streptomyces sp. WAC08241 TaxID=2487421 RepID=UPI000F789610|nr:sirohydrochlorin chelatase [Streptomyces sp. WAC08241]RSS40358.1 sirohydrochlorin chelatase [Streptomyces sp. WAC08241]